MRKDGLCRYPTGSWKNNLTDLPTSPMAHKESILQLELLLRIWLWRKQGIRPLMWQGFWELNE